MKNLFKIFTCLLIIVTLSSCEEDVVVYGNDNFAQLENSNSVSVTENSGDQVEVTVLLGGVTATGVTVDFDITGTADASRYTLSSTSFTIPAGERTGTITFTPVDDDDINGDVDVIFTLSSSNSIPVGIGGEGVNSVSKTITIVDDNVPCNDYTFSITTDTYGDETFWDIIDSNGMTVQSDGDGMAYPNSGIASNTTTDYSFTLADGCYTLRVFDYWGDNGPSYILSCGALIASDQSNNVTLPGDANLDINTVPLPGFRGSPSSPYVGNVETTDFCVNQ